MSKSRLGFSLVFAVLAVACGDSAEEQCNDLISSICKRVLVCTEEITGSKSPAGSESQCVEEVQKSAGVCSRAVDVSSSYDKCIDEIDEIPCDNFLADEDGTINIGFPASCKGVIQVE
jgi:hypothetical protein